MFEAALIMSWS